MIIGYETLWDCRWSQFKQSKTTTIHSTPGMCVPAQRSDWKTRRRNTGASIRKRRSTERARRNVVGGQSAKDHEERLDAPEGASDGTPRPPPPPPSGQRMR
ncbi:uncharacterized protein LOC143373994 isoform X4 [Andrena cerasifolii]|uniref:uncharacterized protein LOC143373994 isoform X4 n=1 Tax=Andrena cerasifolii TaxID=2819439 RepID=UPI004037D34D